MSGSPASVLPSSRGHLHWWQVMILVVTLVVFTAGGYVGYNRFLAGETASASRVQTQQVRRGTVTATVNSTGTVSAVNVARLSIKGGGYLGEVFVKVGDSVQKGQPLARLDTTDLELALRQQRANMSSAQAKLAQVLSGSTEADVQAAIGGVVSAQSQLARAQADYSKLTTPLSSDEAAQAASALEKSRIALQTAQSDYDKVSWRGDVGASQQAVALQQATADYNTALAAYNLKIAPPKDADVEASRKAVQSAQQAVESSNSKLTQLKAGPLPQDVAVARASVEQSAAQVAAAELNLERATLLAPFDGVVQTLTASPGEVVSAAFITIVDPLTLRLDVFVDENDVAKIAMSQNAAMTFDALPGRNFRGRVISIAPSATIQQGVATYQIGVQIDQPQGIKAGMTANIAITYDERSNVLVVPNRAIRVQGRDRVADILLANGSTETRIITVGLSNDQTSEVTRGLTEGEEVVIPTTGTRPGSVPGGIRAPVLAGGR